MNELTLLFTLQHNARTCSAHCSSCSGCSDPPAHPLLPFARGAYCGAYCEGKNRGIEG